jgi:hypothetical protein
MADNTQRPAVLENISDTQMEELERAYDGGDKAAWDLLTKSYGWSNEQSNAVRAWFGDRPSIKGA